MPDSNHSNKPKHSNSASHQLRYAYFYQAQKGSDKSTKGVTVTARPDGTVHIAHRRTGEMPGTIFLILWLCGWTIACLWLLAGLITGGTAGPEAPVWFISLFWAVWLFVFWVIIYQHFSVKTFIFESDRLKLITTLLRFHSERIYRPGDINEIFLHKPKGDDPMSLALTTDRKHILIWQQPYDTLKWIGEKLCMWHGSELRIKD